MAAIFGAMPNPAWLRGPVEGIDPTLLPAAHAFMQTMEDIAAAAGDLTAREVWLSPGGAASVGYHLKHLCGATDRLLTYARGRELNEWQKKTAGREKQPGDPPEDGAKLVGFVATAIEDALHELRNTPAEALLQPRAIGREKSPGTVLGCIVHAAEHAQRHAGQAVTTIRVIKGLGL
jgi:hypothetical protein